MIADDLISRITLLKAMVHKAGQAITAAQMTRVKGRKESWLDLVTQGDLTSEAILKTEISKQFPGDKILAEETAEEPGVRQTKTYLWVIDPIDGTYNYARGRKYSAVSVGLVHQGVILAGAVYNPFTGDFFLAQKGQGAWLNDTRVYCAKTRTTAEAAFITDSYKTADGIRRNIGILFEIQDLTKLIVAGSAVLALCEVACGRVDVYLHTRLKPWDCAAGFLIAQEAGARVTDLKGEEIDIYSREALVANPKLHAQCLAFTRAHSGE